MLRQLGRLLGVQLEKRSFSTIQSRPIDDLIIDPSQEQSLNSEQCILVDGNDKRTGAASKRDCHRVDPDGKLLLHRAFSVFLFNSKDEMLLQRRAAKKVTFPNCLTNACCSHPLSLNGEEENVITAAQRRLNFELGIPLDQMRPDMFTYLTRIHYMDPGDGIWGEHEIDYILILKNDFDIKPNMDEVSETSFIPKHNFNNTITQMGGPITPWFNLIRHHRLKEWWENLHRLDDFVDHRTIHKFPSI